VPDLLFGFLEVPLSESQKKSEQRGTRFLDRGETTLPENEEGKKNHKDTKTQRNQILNPD